MQLNPFRVVVAITLSFTFIPQSRTQDTARPKDNEKFVSKLIRELESGGLKERQQAGLILSRGPRAEAAIPALARALTDDDQLVRYLAARSLAEMGQQSKNVVPELVKALQEPDALFRSEVAIALGSIKSVPEVAIPALIKRLEDQDQSVRVNSAWALGQFGRDAVVGLDPLLELLKREDGIVRLNCAGALVQIGGHPSGVHALLQAIKDSDEFIRWLAVKYLSQNVMHYKESDIKRVVDALSVAVSDSDSAIRAWAVYGLGQFGARARVAFEIVLQAHKNKTVDVEHTTHALKAIDPKQADHEGIK